MVKKWRKVGQDAASDLWELVKENGTTFSTSSDHNDDYLDDGKAEFGFTSNWGWADGEKKGGHQANDADVDADAGNLSDSSLPSPSALAQSYTHRSKASSSSKSHQPATLGSYVSNFDWDERKELREEVIDLDSEEQQVPEQKWTMRTMLGVLGIAAKDTLRWDEEEEEFASL